MEKQHQSSARADSSRLINALTGAQISFPKRENTRCQLAPLVNRRKLHHMLHSWGVPASKGAQQARRPRRGPARQRAIAGASSLCRGAKERPELTRKNKPRRGGTGCGRRRASSNKGLFGLRPFFARLWERRSCECNTRELSARVREQRPTCNTLPSGAHTMHSLVRDKGYTAPVCVSAQRCHHRHQRCQPIRLCVQLRVCSDLDLCSRSRTLTLAVRPAPLR